MDVSVLDYHTNIEQKLKHRLPLLDRFTKEKRRQNNDFVIWVVPKVNFYNVAYKLIDFKPLIFKFNLPVIQSSDLIERNENLGLEKRKNSD